MKLTTKYLNISFPYIAILPSIIVLCVMIIYPLSVSLYWSLTSYTFGQVESLSFIGPKNYVHLLNDADFRFVFINSLIFLTASVNLELILGLGIALLLDRSFKGRNVARTLVMLPFFVAPILVGLQWRWLYNDPFGKINQFLIAIGLIDKGIGWITNPWLALPSVIFAEVWQNTPFMILIILAGLQSLPREPFESAAIDGAGKWQMFRHVTLPLLTPTMIIALIIRSIDAFRVFDIIWIMTMGGPAMRTEILSTWTYKAAFRRYKLGYASAMSYVALVVMAMMFLYYFRSLRKVEG